MNKTVSHTFSFYILVVFLFSLLCSCASQQTPQGGPKDSIPPKILNMLPKNLSTNFKAKKITVEFNEYFKLQNQMKEFSISPEQEKPPLLKVKLKKLEINFQDTLEKNTTYTLNFGKAITDINEGNVLKNFSYVFSTGPKLDSLSIKGRVINSVTLMPEQETLVFILPKNKDSLFGKKPPSIYTLTDSSGNFKISNLKKDIYKIYALKEKGGDKIYQQSVDEIGFLKDSLFLQKNIDSIILLTFKEIPLALKVIDKKIDKEGIININLNKSLEKPELTILEPEELNATKFVKINNTNDSLKLWLSKMDFDSLKIALKEQGKVVENIKISRPKKETYNTEIKASDNLDGGTLNPTKPLFFYLNFPLKNIDTSKVQLLEDSIPRNGLKISKDGLNQLSYSFTYPWKAKENYILKIKEGAFTSLVGSKNKEIVKTFRLGDLGDYGTLHLVVSLPDTNINYMVELLNEKKERAFARYQAKNNQKITFANYKSGVYYIRVLYDENKNGIWDTGNLKQKKQPEKYWYSSQELSIRANWEREEKITVPNISEAYKTISSGKTPPPNPSKNISVPPKSINKGINELRPNRQ